MAFAVLRLEPRVVKEAHIGLDGFRILTHLNKKINVLFGIFRVDLHIPSEDLHGGLTGCGPSKALVEPPDSVVLSDRQSPKSAVECSPSLSHQRLLKEEGEVHLPDTRHLIEEDQSSFEEGIDLQVLGAIDGGVPALEVLCSKLQILEEESVTL